MDQDQDPYIREIQLAEVSNGIKKSPQWPPYHSLQAIPILKELVFSDLAKQPFFFLYSFFCQMFWYFTPDLSVALLFSPAC